MNLIIINPNTRTVEYGPITEATKTWSVRSSDSVRISLRDKVYVDDCGLGKPAQTFFSIMSVPTLFPGVAYVASVERESTAEPHIDIAILEGAITWWGQLEDPMAEAAALRRLHEITSRRRA